MTILLSVLIAIFILSGFLFGVTAIFKDNPKFCIGMFIFVALAWVCACISPLINKNPSKLYQEKVEAVEKANKELEKFLIDYPEFREEYNYD